MARPRQGRDRKEGKRARIKNSGRGSKASGSRSFLSAKWASLSITRFNSAPQRPRPKAEPRGPSCSPRSYGAEARRRGEGNGRVGWASLAGGRAPNKAAGLPPTWGQNGGRRRAVPLRSPRRTGPATPSPRGPSPEPGAGGAAPGPLPASEQRPFGTMGPLPRLLAGRYKGRGARPGTQPGARKVRAEEEEGESSGEGGGGRGSPRAAPRAVQGAALSPTAAAEAGAQTRSPSGPGREGRTQRGAGPPASAGARGGDGPPGSGRRRPAASTQPAPLGGRAAPLSTHPQLRAPAHGGT